MSNDTRTLRYSNSAEGLRARLKPEGECLVYTGHRDRLGYGKLRAYGKPMLAHRFAWEIENGPIPDGLYVDHACHNPSCCNVTHLRLATQKQNMEHQLAAHKGSSSGVRGVHWNKARQKWQVQVRHNKIPHYGGLFDVLAEAERVAKAMRLELFTRNDADRKAA